MPDGANSWRRALAVGLGVYFVTGALSLAAASFGWMSLAESPYGRRPATFGRALTGWDAQFYLDIATHGYESGAETRDGRSLRVAFFPGYPLAIRGVVSATGCPGRVASLIVAHVFLAATFVLLYRLAAERCPEAGRRFPATVLLAFGVLPTTFFMRMGYSESMFAFLTVLVVYALHRDWPIWAAALVCGLATGTRPVGVALLLPVLWHFWRSSPDRTRVLLGVPLLGLLGCWGLLAYVGYQWYALGDPLGFVRVQEVWQRVEFTNWPDKIVALVTLEPFWGTFDWTSQRGWNNSDQPNPLFSLSLANPMFVALAVAALATGAYRKLLNWGEIWLCVGLILIPYVTKGYENSMVSFGRFASVLMPAYLVYGDWLIRTATPWRELVLGIGCGYLMIYSAMFAAGWWMI